MTEPTGAAPSESSCDTVTFEQITHADDGRMDPDRRLDEIARDTGRAV